VSDFVARNRLWARLNTAVSRHPDHLSTPLAVVDLDAFDANAADLARRAGGKPIRVASKSLRVPALIERALASPVSVGCWPTRCVRRSCCTTSV
jgi:D-serine deaminase-like pyridoxal phosphate-dependent protein